MQIFPRSINRITALISLGGGLAGAVLVFCVWYYFSPKHTQVGYAPRQPVPYSHRLHAGQLGMDCRYCHSNVERSPHATIPPVQTCMGCHSQVRTDSARLAPVRAAWNEGAPLEWVRIHRLPDHAYFNHAAHVSANVGCTSCHGRIDQMDVVRQDQPLNIEWCLNCHRNPGPHLRPRNVSVTDMEWTPDPNRTAEPVRPVNPPTYCSGCHR